MEQATSGTTAALTTTTTEATVSATTAAAGAAIAAPPDNNTSEPTYVINPAAPCQASERSSLPTAASERFIDHRRA